MARLQVLLAAICFGTTGTAQALGPAGIDPAAVGSARIAVGGALLVLVAVLARRARLVRARGREVGAVMRRGSTPRTAVAADARRGSTPRTAVAADARRRTAPGPVLAARARQRIAPAPVLAARARRRMAPAPVLAAAAGVALYQVSFFAAVADTGVAVGTIVALGSAPTLAGALEWAVGGRRPERRWAAATALACAGVALLALAGSGDAGVSLPGVLLAVGAGASYAAYTLSAKRLLADGHEPESVMATAFGLGAVALLPVLLLAGGGALVSGGGVALVLFLGVVPTALAYVLFARGLRSLSASETATLTLAEPVTAALLGVVVLGERLTGGGALGAALVLGGLLLLAARAPRRLRPQTMAAPA